MKRKRSFSNSDIGASKLSRLPFDKVNDNHSSSNLKVVALDLSKPVSHPKKRKGLFEIPKHHYPPQIPRSNENQYPQRRKGLFPIQKKQPFSPRYAASSSKGTQNNGKHRPQRISHAVFSMENIPHEPYMLPIAPSCPYCQAQRFHLEPKGFCCSNGAVSLTCTEPPQILWELYTSNSQLSREFRTYVRTYNNTFSFTSFGVNSDNDLCRRKSGIYTFRAQGQIYHYINELFPSNTNPSLLQLYFYDTEEQIKFRTVGCERLNPQIINILVNLLAKNPYSAFFRSLANSSGIIEHSIVIKNNPSQDQRVYNAPTTSQVAAIWVEDDTNNIMSDHHIIVYSKPGFVHRVQYYYGCYDSLQYPLLFPYGECGWHEGIEKNIPHVRHQPDLESASQLVHEEDECMQKGKRKRKSSVSCRAYYAYKLQMRPDSKSILLHSGRLLQQYVVDMYVKLESSRLDFIRFNQKELRCELYEDIMKSVASGESNGSKIGTRIVLPASFIGGPRDMRRRYMDAMTLVQRYGKPDLFITVTCNPSWPEIKAALLPEEEVHNRPDLVTRVFRAKLEILKNDLFKKQIFGAVAAYVYVIEFQKRGLPHAHFLVIMKEASKIRSPDMYDKYVHAEIPNKDMYPFLHEIVCNHMMHGPCGDLNPNNVCMGKKNRCKKKYPKSFCDRTTNSHDGYPVYRRRKNVEPVFVRKQWLDNRWVIPYNPYLLAKFNCHINVEICSTIKAVKYLYKYIYKGHDRVSFHLQLPNNENVIDEIQLFQSARWVSAPKAMWRIYSFPLNNISPAVINLPLHLENQQNVTFQANADLTNIVHKTSSVETKLTAYFKLNQMCLDARIYLYREIPEHFTWRQQQNQWKRRKKGFSIGRIVSANPMEGERYYLRLLLNNVKGATSFTDLKFVDGVQTPTFKNACLLLGLLEADNSIQLCLREASVYHMPQSLRRLFATILVYCTPSNPAALWEEFSDFMIEDYKRLPQSKSTSTFVKALKDIAFILESMGKNINDYHIIPEYLQIDEVEQGNKEIAEELHTQVTEEDLASVSNLNFKQRIAFEAILKRCLSGGKGAFFIDGPGGTGKTYLYRALLAQVRSKGYIALATASSGVAASLLSRGRTAHSRFKLPMNNSKRKSCSIKKQSALAHLLRATKLIVWDEAPMMHKESIEAFDTMMRDICDSEEIFGGKVIVFGGDFRQVLPVVPKGTIAETINASLPKSKLWLKFENFQLTKNIRSQHDPSFSDFLLRIGNGTEPTITDDNIILPAPMVLPYKDSESINTLIDETFPKLKDYTTCLDTMINRAILTPTNDLVDNINNTLINSFHGEPVEYRSFDTPIDISQQVLQEDFFNAMTPSGFPPHLLRLKINSPIMLMRNIDPSGGLCNGTRLICKSFGPNTIGAEIAVGPYKGRHVFIPRIPLLPTENETIAFPFRRTQFPIRLCFAMTINKAQGQTLDFVGIYLPQPVFSHGQLYVALSRAKMSNSVKVLLPYDLQESEMKHSMTRNVVYKDIFIHANIR